MTDRPIRFSAPMIRALIDGRKTSHREIIKPQPRAEAIADGSFIARANDLMTPPPIRYAVGDRIWVREAWKSLGIHEKFSPSQIPPGSDIQYPATYDGWVSKVRPSIHMPRKFSRLTLIVEGVKIERLQDISEEDAIAEGCVIGKITGHAWRDHAEMRLGGDEWASARDWYADFWDKLHGPDAWEANPWVAAIRFKVIKANIGSIKDAA
jgi:hypothetical protein